MPGIDDRLQRDLERLAKGAEATGSLARVTRRKGRHRTARRVQTAALTAVVLAATAGGGYALTRAFRQEEPNVASAPAVRNGKIAFVRGKCHVCRGLAAPDVFVMDADGTNVSQLTHDTSYAIAQGDPVKAALDWSPDGSRLAFVRGSEIWVTNADGSGLMTLTSNERGQDDFPDWSPDGTRIAFTRSELTYDAGCLGKECVPPSEKVLSHLHVMNADGTEIRALTSGLWYEHDPAWSPDGSTILFVRSKSDVEGLNPPGYTPGSPTPDVISMVALDGNRRIGSEVHEIGMVDLAVQDLEWSPDGTRLLFSGTAIYTMKPDGTQVVPLAIPGQGPDGLIMWAATWSPDGKKIAFAAGHTATGDIYTVNSDGTGLTQLTDSSDSEYGPAWQPIPLGAPTVEPPPPIASAAPTSPPPSDIPPPPPPPSQEEFEVLFGPLCGFSGAFGDFDGDGKQDKAAVGFPQTGEGCPDSPQDGGWFVYVTWANGASGGWPLDDCDRVCERFGVADLDGNGTDEFFLVVDAGAATAFLHVYELPIGPQPKHPLEVAPPGADGYPANEPALFPYGGSVTHQDFVTCDEGDGVHILISTSAELDQDQGEWNVHETILSLERGAFTVVSTRDYQVAYDPSGDPLPVPGDACFALD